MLLSQVESIIATAFYMVYPSINSTSYNMCAKLICNESKYCHITALLADLHWLPVKFGIEFKILFIVFKIFRGLAPSYLILNSKTLEL